ncbi:MAG: hypothetical protein ACK419_01640 [Pyrinomonadaceae bacterium]
MSTNSYEHKIIVMCEHVLSGKCSETGCAGYNKNEISRNWSKRLSTGQIYYPYTCHGKVDTLKVKLLDINFRLKTDPNFLFKFRKQDKQ